MPNNGMLGIPPGQTQGFITVQVLGDTTPEPDKTFHVVLSLAKGAVIADFLGTGTIVDDDTAAATYVRVEQIRMLGTNVVVYWSATNSLRYTLEASESVADPSAWRALSPTGRLGPVSAPWQMHGTDPNGAESPALRYYRVKVTP